MQTLIFLMLSTFNTIIFLQILTELQVLPSDTQRQTRRQQHYNASSRSPPQPAPFPWAKTYQVGEILTRKMWLPQNHTSFTRSPPHHLAQRGWESSWMLPDCSQVPLSAEGSERQKSERKMTLTAEPHCLNLFDLGLFSTCPMAYYKIGDRVSESVATDMLIIRTGNIRAVPQ